MPKSRKKTQKKELYCRRCQETKSEMFFYSALDSYLDKNGYMSVCKNCCNEIYNLCLNSELNINKALLKTCRILNIAYVQDAIDSANLQVSGENQKYDSEKYFGIYKAKLGNYFRMYPDAPSTFDSYPQNIEFNVEDENSILENEGEDYSRYLKNTWGSGLSIEDYSFLEEKLSEWKRTHKCDTNSELILMQEICHLQLTVRKARETGGATEKLVKSLQDLIKTANLSPAQANMSNAAKGTEAFGNWIKDIEQLEPAEWWNQNRELFKDVDNLNQYWEDFIVRPIKNFITRSKDFNVRSNVSGNLDFELREVEDDEGE